MRIIDVSKPMTGEAKGGRRYWYVKWHNGTTERIKKKDTELIEGILWLNLNQLVN